MNGGIGVYAYYENMSNRSIGNTLTPDQSPDTEGPTH